VHFILDGYNIIKSSHARGLADGTLEAQRNRLIALIRDRRPQGSNRNTVTVVFDGKGALDSWVDTYSTYHVGAIEVIFSEGASADDTIEKLIAERSGGETVVVTDDKGLRRRLGGTGARSMAVTDFLQRLAAPGRKNTAGEDPADTGDLAPEIDEEFRKRWLK
jgi:predicted RNA-binding protein with PIN domain